MLEPATPPKLSMRGIAKSYGAVRANRGIDLEAGRGEIVGLLGENGSGKSTLMKILFGMVRPDAGTVELDGRPVAIRSPADALAAGIGMVHQHFMLVDAMDVAENLILADGRAGTWLDRDAVAAAIRRASEAYGLGLDPDAEVGDLPFGQRQRVEILKLILRGAELLILDEPTSNLSGPEVEALLGILRRLAAEGRTVVFISHKLGEVLELCDSVVVLRDGAVAGRRATAGATRADLAEMMVGRGFPPLDGAAAPSPGPVLLGVGGLRTAGGRGTPLDAISLDIRGGEILAVAGIDGNGQTELAEVLAGSRPASSGRIAIAGRDVTAGGVGARLEAGLAFIPVDRAGTSLVAGMSVAENLVLRDFARLPYSRFGWLDTLLRRREARERIADYAVRCAGPDAPVRSLSGGNQQKVVVAREIGRGPKVLVAVQPTWGLDPGSTRFVQDAIRSLAAGGAAILYVSAELEEVLAIGHRVAAMQGGRLSRPVARAALDVTRLGLLMSGDPAAWAAEADLPLAA